MSFFDVPQGRVLAITLPSVTLMAHAATFVVLEAVFADSWGSSWVATYDLVAAAASVVGLLGAVHKRRILMATYLLVHSITLSLFSTMLLINVLPSSFASSIPYLSQLRHDDNFERGMCQELDNGFGWDERWLNDCASSFDTLNKGAMWVGVAMVSAQWLVLINLGSWLREKPTKSYEEFDVEKRWEKGIIQD
ncbi:hypothetical protein PMIN06_000880 [Paraphaeosphaeria minitans]|uniref:Uncharacterized protein n=1 Tax=Paraphaeosphaeria minitans TaxID=565426 RepID=A0A9P6GL28_9PLEO|nr:hypothetical protein PMIN01_05000 [Paraphaeosphaeria minitans]